MYQLNQNIDLIHRLRFVFVLFKHAYPGPKMLFKYPILGSMPLYTEEMITSSDATYCL